MLAHVPGWDMAEVESASDHNILKCCIRLEADKLNNGNTLELKYIIKEKQSTWFYNNLFHTIS